MSKYIRKDTKEVTHSKPKILKGRITSISQAYIPRKNASRQIDINIQVVKNRITKNYKAVAFGKLSTCISKRIEKNDIVVFIGQDKTYNNYNSYRNCFMLDYCSKEEMFKKGILFRKKYNYVHEQDESRKLLVGKMSYEEVERKYFYS